MNLTDFPDEIRGDMPGGRPAPWVKKPLVSHKEAAALVGAFALGALSVVAVIAVARQFECDRD